MRWSANKRKKAHDEKIEQLITDIYSDFGIRVEVSATDPSVRMLSNLYDALDLVHEYYGIPYRSPSVKGLAIVIEEEVYADKTFFRKGKIVDGMYSSHDRSIHLPASHPGAFVHEFIHAIDYRLRADSKAYGDMEPYSGKGAEGLRNFLEEKNVSEKDIADFNDVFGRMHNVLAEYLRLPSEIIARMGAYSFWKDNEEECAHNPFLHFSYAPYKMVNKKTHKEKIIDQFPFHSIAALRYFVHYASAETSRQPYQEWHPANQVAFAFAHSSEWYHELCDELLDARIDASSADENMHTAPNEAAKENLFFMKNNLRSKLSSCMLKVESEELNRRVSAMKSAFDKAEVVINYLDESRNVAFLNEREAKKAKARKRIKEKSEIEIS